MINYNLNNKLFLNLYSFAKTFVQYHVYLLQEYNGEI